MKNEIKRILAEKRVVRNQDDMYEQVANDILQLFKNKAKHTVENDRGCSPYCSGFEMLVNMFDDLPDKEENERSHYYCPCCFAFFESECVCKVDY